MISAQVPQVSKFFAMTMMASEIRGETCASKRPYRSERLAGIFTESRRPKKASRRVLVPCRQGAPWDGAKDEEERARMHCIARANTAVLLILLADLTRLLRSNPSPSFLGSPLLPEGVNVAAARRVRFVLCSHGRPG